MSDQPAESGHGGRPPLRVLQLIGDTDAVPEHRAAVELHRGLTDLGVEVRTLALAPGDVGGLEELVPAVAHARRSLAARTQVTQERRWADVVVLHGPRASAPATLRRRDRRPPTVIAVWAPGDDADPGARGRVIGVLDDALARRVESGATVLVVDDPARAERVARRTGRSAAQVAVAADPDAWARLLASVVAPGGERAR